MRSKKRERIGNQRHDLDARSLKRDAYIDWLTYNSSWAQSAYHIPEEYIRNDDVTIDVESSMDKDAFVRCLSAPMTTKGSRIFMNISENADVLTVVTEIMKQHSNIEYILVFNRNYQDDSSLMEYVTGLDNSRILFETQYISAVDQEILCKADRVLFKTPNAIIKLLHGNSDIEKTRAKLKCGEALYISEGHEICKVCFENVHNTGK